MTLLVYCHVTPTKKTQSFASVLAKLCIRQRKALHPPTQSFALANAKHCISQRKALQRGYADFDVACRKNKLFVRYRLKCSMIVAINMKYFLPVVMR